LGAVASESKQNIRYGKYLLTCGFEITTDLDSVSHQNGCVYTYENLPGKTHNFELEL